MIVQMAHKIRLNPTPEQKSYFWRAAGVARFSFNWGLERYNAKLDAGEKVNGRMLKKEFNAIKTEQFPWVSEVTSWAYQGAFDDLQAAFRNFFDKNKKGLIPKAKKPRKDGKPNGWPRFKSRNRTRPAFYLANTAFRCEGHWIRMPHIGWVNMCEPLRFEGKILRGVVSYSGGHWHIAITVEFDYEAPDPHPGQGQIDAVHFGVRVLGKTSGGDEWENPKALGKHQRRLKKLQKKLSRQIPESNNWYKTKDKIAKLHARIANIRNNASHNMTTEVVRSYETVIVENWDVKEMMGDHWVAEMVGDVAFFEKRRQLTYKTALMGGNLIVLEKNFPSSKKCSRCNAINDDLKPTQTRWQCPSCGQWHNREDNSAVNVLKEGIRILEKNKYNEENE